MGTWDISPSFSLLSPHGLLLWAHIRPALADLPLKVAYLLLQGKQESGTGDGEVHLQPHQLEFVVLHVSHSLLVLVLVLLVLVLLVLVLVLIHPIEQPPE